MKAGPDHGGTQASGRALALDWGAARIGVAASDPTRSLASPQPAIAEKDKAAQIAKAAALVQALGATVVLIGLPLHLDGSPGSSARSATMFAEKLQGALDAAGGGAVEVILVDERFSTHSASERLAESRGAGRGARGRAAPRAKDGSLDSAAAAILLQAWLDGRGPREHS